MIDTAGTLCAGAEAVKQAGATRVVACATHPLFSGAGAASASRQQRARRGRRLRHRAGRPGAREPQKVRVLPVDGILAQTIAEIFHHGSVSQIFGGENQLF